MSHTHSHESQHSLQKGDRSQSKSVIIVVDEEENVIKDAPVVPSKTHNRGSHATDVRIPILFGRVMDKDFFHRSSGSLHTVSKVQEAYVHPLKLPMQDNPT